MPRNAMQVGSETHACMTIHRIGGVMRGASFGIVALAAAALMPAASQADDMSTERDFSREIQMGCEAWGMASGVPDYVCIAQLQGDVETGESHVVPPGAAIEASMLTSAMAWVANISDLPAATELPRVVQGRPARVAIVAGDSILPNMAMILAALDDHAGVAKFAPQYVDADRTIYLPIGWTGETPAEFSVLVREMVHHLQNAAGKTYACPQERNAVAFDVQDRWLGLFDRDLAQEFGIDPYVLEVSKQCIP